MKLIPFAFLLPALTHANIAAAQTNMDSAGPDGGTTVIVTARRRLERLNDVPASIDSMSGADLAVGGIATLRSVADLTPNFSMLDNYRPGLQRFQMRGLVTPQVGDPPVVFVLDGVTAPSPEFVNQPLFDVDRVEVLRGAQGALYGRSSVGGAINITTRQPSDQVEATVHTSYGNGDTYRLSGTASGPLLQGRGAFRLGGYTSQSDGLVENTFLQRGADYHRGTGWFAQAKFFPTARATVDVRAQMATLRDGIGYYDAAGISQDSIEDFSAGTSQNILGNNLRRISNLSLKVENEFDFATLTLAAGYSQARSIGSADADLVALSTSTVNYSPQSQLAVDHVRAWTAEARLVSTAGDRLTWGLGFYYQDRTGTNVFSIYDDPGQGDVARSHALLRPDLELFAIVDDNSSLAWALSGQMTYKITDAVEVALAARYDVDTRTSVDPRDDATTFARATFRRFQPNVTLSYHVTPGAMVYAGYSQGFRSGGFNQYSPVVPRAFGAEATNSEEIGFKLFNASRQASLRGALFRNTQTNAQITRFNPNSFTLENIAIDDVQSSGGELELAAAITPHLKLRANYGYTHSQIRAFAVNPSLVGATMPYVSPYNMTVQLDYDRPVRGTVDFHGHVVFRSEGPHSFTLDFPDLTSKAHSFVDGRIGFRDKGWAIEAYVDNLFDERRPEDVFGVFNGAVELARQPNKPRQFGITLSYDFSGHTRRHEE